MNPTDPRPERPPPEWLGAYVDGELDEVARRAVEDWLRHDPAAREELAAQQFLSPRNEPFWQSASVRQPDESAWGPLRDRIEQRLSQPADAPIPSSLAPRRTWWLAGALALVTTTAAVFVTVLALNRPQPEPQPPFPPELVEDDDLEPLLHVATADDVDIISLPEAARAALVVGKSPLDGEVVKLASFEDVDIRGIGPDARGEFPELHMTPHGVTIPMVWPAPREER